MVIGSLVISLTKVLLALLLSLVERPALGRVWVVPDFFNFPMMETAVLLETFNTIINCVIPFPRYMPHHSTLSEIYGQFLGQHGIVSALTYTVNYGTLYRQVFVFQIHVQTAELDTG